MASTAAAPAPAQTSRTKPIPAALVPAALVLAVVVAVLSLLPSVAQAVWELPHFLLLGLVVTYGVFAQQKNNGDAAAKDDGAPRAWSSRYRPDDPLVVVAPDHAAGDDGEDGASVRPFSLPVRRLKPVVEESEAGGATDTDGGIGEETDSSASTAGFWAGTPPTAPSPPSVLDAFDSTPPSTVSKGFPGYDSPSPNDQSSCNEDEEEEEEEEEGTDWDEDADGSEEMTAPSSFPGDFVACRNRRYDGAGDGDGESVDEELVELATQAAPACGDEVDRKADEFIAKFREQIRLQRSRPRVT
ncbi:uncharacterized protein [Lolium perenne]|uniref:uncharacterized protein n=1 Tax=Lolium perenne TaxID=4522 RepID=UPI0021EABB30|nr:uncharacterized protein LOC127306817 [Lolium perenne]